MSGGDAADWALTAALLGAGLAAGVYGLRRLARRRAAPPPPPAFPRLTGYDLVSALLLVLILPLALTRAWPDALQELDPTWILLLNLAIALVVLLFLRWRAGPAPRATAPFTPAAARWSLALYAWFLPGWLGLQLANQMLVEAWSGRPAEQAAAEELRTLHGVSLAVGVLVAVLVQPVVEELLFRGYLQRFLATRPGFSPLRVLVCSSFVFASFHEVQVALPILACGLLFGWAYQRTGRIEAAILLHVLHNGIGTLGILLLPGAPSP